MKPAFLLDETPSCEERMAPKRNELFGFSMRVNENEIVDSELFALG